MSEDLERALEQVIGLCRVHGVRRLALFGSTARGDFNPERSDVDLLVEFPDLPPAERARRYFDLLEDLERLFGRSVDLVEPDAVRYPFVRRHIDASKVVLFEAA